MCLICFYYKSNLFYKEKKKKEKKKKEKKKKEGQMDP